MRLYEFFELYEWFEKTGKLSLITTVVPIVFEIIAKIYEKICSFNKKIILRTRRYTEWRIRRYVILFQIYLLILLYVLTLWCIISLYPTTREIDMYSYYYIVLCVMGVIFCALNKNHKIYRIIAKTILSILCCVFFIAIVINYVYEKEKIYILCGSITLFVFFLIEHFCYKEYYVENIRIVMWGRRIVAILFVISLAYSQLYDGIIEYVKLYDVFVIIWIILCFLERLYFYFRAENRRTIEINMKDRREKTKGNIIQYNKNKIKWISDDGTTYIVDEQEIESIMYTVDGEIRNTYGKCTLKDGQKFLFAKYFKVHDSWIEFHIASKNSCTVKLINTEKIREIQYKGNMFWDK